MTVTLRKHQIEAADAVENAWRAGVLRPLVNACVGSGKSLIYAELSRREIARGGRALICAHTRELVEQNAAACRLLMPGVHVGINAHALGERTWRAPVISAAIQSIHRSAQSFGPVTLLLIDESHLVPHSESGMYRALIRGLGGVG
jgi:DNA repair protein RadD